MTGRRAHLPTSRRQTSRREAAAAAAAAAGRQRPAGQPCGSRRASRGTASSCRSASSAKTVGSRACWTRRTRSSRSGSKARRGWGDLKRGSKAGKPAGARAVDRAAHAEERRWGKRRDEVSSEEASETRRGQGEGRRSDHRKEAHGRAAARPSSATRKGQKRKGVGKERGGGAGRVECKGQTERMVVEERWERDERLANAPKGAALRGRSVGRALAGRLDTAPERFGQASAPDSGYSRGASDHRPGLGSAEARPARGGATYLGTVGLEGQGAGEVGRSSTEGMACARG